ncbi:MAG: hypothetical protein ABIH70_01275 [Chloroflexota bacterium]
MAKITCPKCGAESFFSLAQSIFQGPFRCSACKELFTIRIEDDELKSCEPLSPQELQKFQIRKHYQ